MKLITNWVVLLSTFRVLVTGKSYIPQFIKGVPSDGIVEAIAPPDIRGKPLFRINHTVLNDAGVLTRGLVHRTYDEFKDLDSMIRRDFWISNPKAALPNEGSASATSMGHYVMALYRDHAVRVSTLFSDFLSINWDGTDVAFMNHGLSGFMKMILWDRVPNFMPEPPRIEKSDFLVPETPFERYVYFLAFKHPRGQTKEYLEFFNSYVESSPSWEGPINNSDVLHPRLMEKGSFEYPFHYNFTYVHFLPGGYLNSKTVRTSYLGNSKFTFLDEDQLTKWIRKLYLDVDEPVKPTKILDIGTGTGGSAFVLATLFPDAQVMGIDLAPGYIRFCRQEMETRNFTNLQFYQADGEDMTAFVDDNSIDFINFAYVLHEMPKENSMRIVSEMYRILKPAGKLNGFEVPYEKNPIERYFMDLWNDWNHDWHAGSEANQGPEPYISEYEDGLKLPEYMKQIGFERVQEIKHGLFDSIFTATKT